MISFKSGENVSLKKEKFTKLILATLTAYILTMVLLFVFSLVITYTNINENISIYFVKSTTYISCIVSGFIAAGKIANKGWLSGAISGLCYALILVLLSFISKNIQFSISYTINFLCCIFSGILGGIIGINLKN